MLLVIYETSGVKEKESKKKGGKKNTSESSEVLCVSGDYGSRCFFQITSCRYTSFLFFATYDMKRRLKSLKNNAENAKRKELLFHRGGKNVLKSRVGHANFFGWK